MSALVKDRIGLDAMLDSGCGDPNCKEHHVPQKEIFLKSACHPTAGVKASYRRGGTLRLVCNECKMPLVDIVVGL